jgi:hypothetical protein
MHGIKTSNATVLMKTGFNEASGRNQQTMANNIPPLNHNFPAK